LIGDGLGQKLNHVTNKGQNDLKEAHMVVELSRPHPAANIKLMHELQWASNFSSDWNPTTVAGIMMYDQMNQAIGRNAGYRHIGSETIVLCDPTFFGALRAASRYKLTPYSALLSQDTNAYRQKQNTKIIEDNLQIISPLARTLIDGLLEPYSFVSSEGFRFGIQCLKNEVEVKRLMVALTSLREVAESAKAARTDPRISFLGQFETLEGELLARLSHVVSA
jgi:hypothetical protein